MTDILFVNSTDKLALDKEVNGTMLLATILRQAGHRAKILRFCQAESNGKDYDRFIEEMLDQIFAHSPKCVSFYTLWPYYHMMLRLAKEIKLRRPDILTVMGGPQATATAAETMKAMDFVDYVCTGEGENTVVPFFEILLGISDQNISTIPGLYYRKDGQVVHNDLRVPLTELDHLPFWDEGLYLEDYPDPSKLLEHPTDRMPIDVGRGCPFQCTFCGTSRFLQRTYRLKSPERILAEIRYYHERFGFKHFMFSHDAFTVNMKLVDKVCDGIIESGLKITWQCTTRVNCVTEELLLKMKRAGMTGIQMGVETGSERMQKVIKKNLDLSRIISVAEFCKNHKIPLNFFFINGFPEETEQDLNETVKLIFDLKDMGVEHLSLSYCMFTPGTEMTNRYFDQLVFDPTMDVYFYGDMGWEAEKDFIQRHKEIFPCFFHLNTPLRNEFRDLVALLILYKWYPKTFYYIRRQYDGNELQIFRDLHKANFPFFQNGRTALYDALRDRSLEFVDNLIDAGGYPNANVLKSLVRYEQDLRRAKDSTEDVFQRKAYDFSFSEIKNRVPLESLSQTQSMILIQKFDGKLSVKLLESK